jgi:hypothetical protein
VQTCERKRLKTKEIKTEKVKTEKIKDAKDTKQKNEKNNRAKAPGRRESFTSRICQEAELLGQVRHKGELGDEITCVMKQSLGTR